MDTSPSSTHHPLPVKAINTVLGLLNTFGLGKVDISLSALLNTAQQETGLHSLGDEHFMPALKMLLEDLQTYADLNPFGRLHAKATVLNALKNQLWANACYEEHPELASKQISDPVIIIGPVRSGTTRLQRMLASDRRFQHLTAWEGFNPAPRPNLHDAGREQRRQEVVKFLSAGEKINPGAFAAHPMDADAADEEILLLNQSFAGLSYAALYHVPTFTEQLLEHEPVAAYASMARMLNLVTWTRNKTDIRPWILKTPQHMLHLNTLLQTFPKAKLIFIHRDPIKTVASTLSLAWNFSVLNTNAPRRAAIRDTWMRLCETMAQRCIAARNTLPADQQCDVYYDEMNKDWPAVMERIYGFIGLEYTPEAKKAMGDWLTASESANIHGNHRYDLADYGLSPGEVDARMRFYRDQYQIPYESGRP
ncbi:MAG: sulfotransferase [Rhodocyclaceae bacterium]|nr:MAG: sulfotransferase [Rhodocyclaceae bacterium]